MDRRPFRPRRTSRPRITLKIEAVDAANGERLWTLHDEQIWVGEGESITFTVPVVATEYGLILDVKITDD